MNECILSIESKPPSKATLRIKGNEVDLMNCIASAMEENGLIRMILIAGVMAWADKAGIPRNELGNMVILHK